MAVKGTTLNDSPYCHVCGGNGVSAIGQKPNGGWEPLANCAECDGTGKAGRWIFIPNTDTQANTAHESS